MPPPPAARLGGRGTLGGNTAPGMTESEFWDFSMNEQAFQDFPTFVKFIDATKRRELGGEGEGEGDGDDGNAGDSSPVAATPEEEEKGTGSGSGSGSGSGGGGTNGGGSASGGGAAAADAARGFKLTVVGHSMGATVAIMYMLTCLERKAPHHVSNVLLLSPAGVHIEAPLVTKVLGPVLDRTVARWVDALKTPKPIAVVMAKIVQDVRNSQVLKDLMSLQLQQTMGGRGSDLQRSPFALVHRMVYNSLTAGTSTKVYKHFRQIYTAQRFQAYDYGPDENMRVYGSPSPPEYLSRYHLFDVPVHVVAGLDDHLIGPVNVLRHYNALHKQNPRVAFMHSFEGIGHIDFNYSTTAEVLDGILALIPQTEPRPAQAGGGEDSKR